MEKQCEDINPLTDKRCKRKFGHKGAHDTNKGDSS